ncbi:MAG: isoprenylcysteine carboxylmethyltransferase family protein [bacterium]
MNFTYFYVVFLLLSTAYRIKRLIKSYEVEEREAKVYSPMSYPILLLLYLLITIGSILEYFYFRYIIFVREEINLIVSLIGLITYVSVIPIRTKAVAALGRYMAADIKIFEDHKLIKEGPYRYLRHPLSVCVIIEAVSLTLIPNSYYSLIFALLVFIPFVLYRTALEEKALIEKFGQDYIKYQGEVYGYLPLKRVKLNGLGGGRSLSESG